MIDKDKLKLWLDRCGGDTLFIDEGGLCLHSNAGDYLEIGGAFDEETDEDDKA